VQKVITVVAIAVVAACITAWTVSIPSQAAGVIGGDAAIPTYAPLLW
jgi:hypothetical protein